MVKVVINTCFGGFGLSQEACEWLYNRGFKYVKLNPIYEENSTLWSKRDKYYAETWDMPRHHPLLVECVETLKEKANDYSASLSVYELSSNLYRIEDYDGRETLIEPDLKYDFIDGTKF